MESSRLQRWQRIAQITVDSDEVRALRAAITELAKAPDEPERRQLVRTLAKTSGLELPLPAFLIAEAYAQNDTRVVAGLRDETAKAYTMIGESQKAAAIDAGDANDGDRVAFSSYLVGDWPQAAELLVGLANETNVEDRVVYLRAAGRLFHNTGHNERAMDAFRAIVVRRPSDLEALLMIASLINSQAITPFIISQPAQAPAQPSAPDDEIQAQPTVIGMGVDGRSPGAKRPTGASTPIPKPADPGPRKSIRSVGPAPATFVLASVEDSELDEKLAFAFSDGGDDTALRRSLGRLETTPGVAVSSTPIATGPAAGPSETTDNDADKTVFDQVDEDEGETIMKRDDDDQSETIMKRADDESETIMKRTDDDAATIIKPDAKS